MMTEQTLLAAGLGYSALVLLFFALGWNVSHRKRLGKPPGRGAVLNAVGYGLLPAAAVWKTFEHHTFLGEGRPLFPPVTELAFFTEDGRFAPCRAEMCLLILGFLAMSLWLILRKQEVPRNGDLLPVSLVIWAGIRIVTESLRAETATVWLGQRMIRILACAVLLLCMAVWTARWAKKKTNRHAWMNWLAVVPALGALMATAMGVLSVGSEIGDLAVTAGCSAAAVCGVLAMNGEG